MDLERFILEHGAWSYLVTFVWTFFEGETFVLLAGFASAQGLLSAPLVLIAAWLGSFAGDQCYFWIGRHFGLRLLARRPQWRRHVDRALGWLTRYDAAFILSFRFIYGIRNFSSFALGISAIMWQRFLVINLRRRAAVGRHLHRRRLCLRPCLRAYSGPGCAPLQHRAARHLGRRAGGRSSRSQAAAVTPQARRGNCDDEAVRVSC